MQRCPICRATLNGADTCRRCRAELRSVMQAEADSEALVDAAMHHLARNDSAGAEALLEQAVFLHATPAAVALLDLVARQDRPR
jgi:methylphosphotriester-DNA--protein-cysteine methyltransferase